MFSYQFPLKGNNDDDDDDEPNNDDERKDEPNDESAPKKAKKELPSGSKLTRPTVGMKQPKSTIVEQTYVLVNPGVSKMQQLHFDMARSLALKMGKVKNEKFDKEKVHKIIDEISAGLHQIVESESESDGDNDNDNNDINDNNKDDTWTSDEDLEHKEKKKDDETKEDSDLSDNEEIIMKEVFVK